jgi:ATP-dependent Clp protease ATP-binding subunit ClpC
MTEERVPKLLQDKRLINLDAARLVSGATASVAAERLLKISDEIRRARNIVLTIENVHSLIGISTGAEESMDLVDVLGSVIGNKQFVVIATSEPPTYGEKQTNTTLGQIFKILQIVEPEKNLAIRIVEAKTMVLEFKHKIFFSYDAIAELINLSFRYLPDEYMPEKAIILLEEIALLKTKTKKKNDTVVRIEDVAEVVSRKIKIPVSEVSQKESDMLLHLEDLIHKRLIDQEEAVGAVSRALRRARAELTSDKRPIANFLFLGPTGVGKTQLAKTVAEIYFGSENNMVRLDMSEYQDSSSSDKLIGGAGISGFLTTQIKEKPFSILLLDELEKAHGDILNLFLQIMDDGRLTDGTGRVIDFTNVIIIATSNAGSQYIQDSIRDKRPVERITHELISGELSKHYRPELLNRFDGIIVFKPLSIKDVVAIARLMVEDVRVNLEEKHGVMLEIQEDALNQLATIGYEPEFGARPMRRAIQNNLDNPLATLILEKKVERRDTVQYTLKGLVVVKGKPL